MTDKIKDLQKAVDNDTRYRATMAKKIRATIKPKTGQIVNELINEYLKEDSKLSVKQKVDLGLSLLKFGIDVEKIVDGLKDDGETTTTTKGKDIPKGYVAPIVRMRSSKT